MIITGKRICIGAETRDVAASLVSKITYILNKFHLCSTLMWITLILAGCDGGNGGDYPDLNVRWRREVPPKREIYSSITFSRKIDGTWRDCLKIDGSSLGLQFEPATTSVPPKFILSTAGSRVVVAVLPELYSKPGIAARNLGLKIVERDSGIVIELKEGQQTLIW